MDIFGSFSASFSGSKSRNPKTIAETDSSDWKVFIRHLNFGGFV